MMNKDILEHCSSEGFTEDELYGAYKIFFGTLVSESRLKIMRLLQQGKRNVSEIMRVLGMDQTAVSHDLARLKKCGFVTVTVNGSYRYYSLNKSTIEPLLQIIDEHMKHHCIHILKSAREK